MRCLFGDQDSTAEAMRALGAPQALIDRYERGPEPYPVLPENWTAVQAFMALQTQWEYSRKGRLKRLPVERIDIVLRRRFAHDETLFEKLQLMEHAAIRAHHDMSR